jgi:methionyl-tRNA synthetase
MAPWKISIESDEDKEKLKNILFILVSNLRKIAIMLLPFFDTKMRELLSRIGTPYDDSMTLVQNLEADPDEFIVLEKGEPLYMRIGK